MSDDLVDRITKARKDKAEANALDHELALRRSITVEENSDFLWLELIKEVKGLVEKFNRTFPAPPGAEFIFSERAGSPPTGFDVNRQVFPIVRLAVWRTARSFIEFSLDRTEASFANPRGASGRIDIVADDNRNVYLRGKGELLSTAKKAAEYLLTPALE
jgi:hypothetical protein